MTAVGVETTTEAVERLAQLLEVAYSQHSAATLRALLAEREAMRKDAEKHKAIVDGLNLVGFLNEAGEYCSLARYEAYKDGSDDDCSEFTTYVFVRTWTQQEIDENTAKAERLHKALQSASIDSEPMP